MGSSQHCSLPPDTPAIYPCHNGHCSFVASKEGGRREEGSEGDILSVTVTIHVQEAVPHIPECYAIQKVKRRPCLRSNLTPL